MKKYLAVYDLENCFTLSVTPSYHRLSIKFKICIRDINYISVNQYTYANHSRTYHYFKSTACNTTGWVNCVGWIQSKPVCGGQHEQNHIG